MDFELPHTPEQLEELAADITDLLDSLDGGYADGGLALELLLMNVLEEIEEALQDQIRTVDMPLTRSCDPWRAQPLRQVS